MHCPVERKKKKSNSKICYHGYAQEVNIYKNWKFKKKKNNLWKVLKIVLPQSLTSTLSDHNSGKLNFQKLIVVAGVSDISFSLTWKLVLPSNPMPAKLNQDAF